MIFIHGDLHMMDFDYTPVLLTLILTLTLTASQIGPLVLYFIV